MTRYDRERIKMEGRGYGQVFAMILGVLLTLLYACGAFGTEPQFTVENKCPPTFIVTNKTPVPVVTAPQPFRQSTYNPSHRCPNCGTSQYVVSGWNRDGTHNHQCPRCSTVWSH